MRKLCLNDSVQKQTRSQRKRLLFSTLFLVYDTAGRSEAVVTRKSTHNNNGTAKSFHW